MAIKLVLFVLKIPGSKLEVLILLIFFFVSQFSLRSQDLGRVSKVYNSSDKKQDMTSIWSKGPVVLIFYSPDCPLSIKYTKTLNDLDQHFKGQVSFYVVFSGTYHSREEVDEFIEKYGIVTEVLFDPKFKLAEKVEATITPEVFLISLGRTLYSGAIDDWVIKLGVTKKEVQTTYLKNAINQVLQNKEVSLRQTKAIGCFIK